MDSQGSRLDTCRLLRRAHCSRVSARWQAKNVPSGEAPATEASPKHDPEAPESRGDEKTVDQALAQEQAVFERKIQESGALFRLQLAMGWMTFLLVPVSIAAFFIYPPSAIGTVPLNSLAIWNWRRMLKRDSGDIEVTTKRPEQDKERREDDDERSGRDE